jgi:hypothetical protein
MTRGVVSRIEEGWFDEIEGAIQISAALMAMKKSRRKKELEK